MVSVNEEISSTTYFYSVICFDAISHFFLTMKLRCRSKAEKEIKKRFYSIIISACLRSHTAVHVRGLARLPRDKLEARLKL